MKSVIRRKPYLIPLFLVIGVGALALFGWLVMTLWNVALVPAAGAQLITFWQALGLLVLSRILVGGFGGKSGRPRRYRPDWPSKEMWTNMTPEEKAKFKENPGQRWRGGCFMDEKKESSNPATGQ